MKTEVMELNIADVMVDPQYYPRVALSWTLVGRYGEAIRAGATLPPITVGKREDSKYALIDGAHRLKALQTNQLTTVTAILSMVPVKDWFLEAVRLNAIHGSALNDEERRSAVSRLSKAGYPKERISSVVCLPVDRVERILVPPSFRQAAPAQGVFRRNDGNVHRTPDTEDSAPTRHDMTIETALVFLGAAVTQMNLKRLPREELRAWAQRARMIAEALEAAVGIPTQAA